LRWRAACLASLRRFLTAIALRRNQRSRDVVASCSQSASFDLPFVPLLDGRGKSGRATDFNDRAPSLLADKNSF
ncbi:hypothetical protein, partial [Caballeronia sp. INML3]|uniref:hypothetical protein n=1 Tax=Caballeronia sp. INML3 TaxID=2921752 RepID=UPI002032769D